MAYTAVAARVYKDPLTVEFANDMINNDAQIFTQIAKARLTMDTSAVASAIDSFNIAAVGRTGVGLYSITLSSGFTNAVYQPIFSITAEDLGQLNVDLRISTGGTMTTGIIFPQVFNNGNANADPHRIYMVAFGV